MRGFDAKAGEMREENVVGPHGLGIRNIQGEKLVEWCHMNNLLLISTTNRKGMDMEKPRRWKQKPDRFHPDRLMTVQLSPAHVSSLRDDPVNKLLKDIRTCILAPIRSSYPRDINLLRIPPVAMSRRRLVLVLWMLSVGLLSYLLYTPLICLSQSSGYRQ
ncbi:hypothetical protein RRG08_009471 [Elysia crispata]|uniref:Uncharacterized protein n=1 Tax=Elysia crispata TaxID=231223 RepID=A0AAE1E401_9GAST|nr:hypothetical protein RRG08_009471 [Elysia crispata]